MSNKFDELMGFWYGKKKLWLKPGEEPIVCHMVAVVERTKGKSDLCISYVWKYEKKPIKGSLKILAKNETHYTCVWEDSWHNKNSDMILDGVLLGTKIFSFLGSYSTGKSSLWGWKVKLNYNGKGILPIYMYNITPEGEEMLAVDIFLYKVKPAYYENKFNKLSR